MVNILINGEAKETISVNDRGLLYGDGLFETMAVRNGHIPLWETHWQRLSLGCEKLSINLPDKEIIEKEIVLLCEAQNKPRFVIKLIISRGEGQRGYRFTENQNVTRILSSHAWPNYSERFQTEGVAVCYCETTLSDNKKLAGIKHLNRLEQVLARNEWDNDFQEGLMLSANDKVIDGTMSNIFAVIDSEIYTPSLALSGVAGVMRKTVINIAKENNILISEKEFSKSEVEMADELFLTNSLFGIWPIKNIGEKQFTKVGKVTKRLQEEINKIC